MSAVHTLELRPFLLEPVSVVGNDEDEVTCTSRFGHTWQERTFPLRAIQIFADDWVNEIRNISQRDTIDEVRVGGPHYLFQLLTDEYIHQLDVRKVSSGGISALRIHTNKRKSQWYGGDRGSITSLEAPSGYFINGIVGTINARSCIELSGYCCPFSSILKPDPENPVVQNSPKCGAGLFDGAQLAFTELCSDIRAIIIRCDQHVERLWVLSAHEYALFLVASDSGPLGKNEHCIEFYEHERIKAVHIQSHEVVNAIRLDTTHRSTPWFGKCTHGAISIFPSRFMDTRSVWGPSPHVLGFYGTIGSRYVGSLGVIFGVDQSACQVKDKGLKTICDLSA